MDNRIKQAFRRTFSDNDEFDFSALRHTPPPKRGFSGLAVFIVLLGWAAFFTYILVLVNVSDFSSFLEESLSPDRDWIRYMALLFFAPLIFTLIGFLVNQNYKSYRRALAYQEKLEELARTLETKIEEKTRKLEESNQVIKAEIEEKANALRSLLLLEKAVKTTKTGITIKDTDNIILFINDADAIMHGYQPSELIGKDAQILAANNNIKKLSMEELKELKSWARESINIRKDGTTFPVALVSDVVLDDDGKPVATVTTCEDITEIVHLRGELSASLEENNRLSIELKNHKHISTQNTG